MDRVYIPQLLQQPEHTLAVDIDRHLPDLDTLTPVRGTVTISHQGTYLAIKAGVETIVTLACYRCLQNYNHRIAIAPQELIWLQAALDPANLPPEQEVAIGDLVETLPPDGYFYPLTWLYEQICLALPQRQICDPNCNGIEVAPQSNPPPATALDRRWAVLTQLQRQLNDSPDSQTS